MAAKGGGEESLPGKVKGTGRARWGGGGLQPAGWSMEVPGQVWCPNYPHGRQTGDPEAGVEARFTAFRPGSS